MEKETKLTLGDSMKNLETPYTDGVEVANGISFGIAKVPEGHYCIIRVDGRAFHTFTRSFRAREIPFSPIICGAMKAATEALIEEFQPVIAYSQSDEITLVIDPHKVTFSRKVSKLNSIASAVATAYFNEHIRNNHGKISPKPAVFDARTFGVPTRESAALVLLWRQNDAIRNSISTLARAHFSQKQLDSKKSNDKINMLAGQGIYWDELEYGLKYGLIAYRGTMEVEPNEEYLASLPERARQNLLEAGGKIIRSYTEYIDNLPPFKDIANLPEVLFDRAAPVLKRNIFEYN